MEEQKEEVVEKKQNNKPIHFFRNLLITILVIIGLGYGISYLSNQNVSEDKYSLTYTSVFERKDYAYVNVSVTTTKEFTLKASNFSYYENGVPKMIQGIVTMVIDSAYVIDGSIDIPQNGGNVIIALNIKYSDLPSNFTLMYNGKNLLLGEKLEFKL